MEECPNCGSTAFDGTVCASCGYDSYESVITDENHLGMQLLELEDE